MPEADENTPQQAAIEPIEPPEAATAPQEPESVPGDPQTLTAQIPATEPLPSQSEPFDSAQGKPNPAPTPSEPATIVHAARDLLVKARATIQFRKTVKLEKILTTRQKKNHITNDEVEKLLHVSDATATRYLSQLEREGKIRQIGKTGKAVTYTKP